MASELIGNRGRSHTSYSLLKSKFTSVSYTSSKSPSADSSIALQSFVTERDGGRRKVYDRHYHDNQSEEDFITVSYSDHEAIEQKEFQILLNKELGVKRSCLHKGLITFIIFLLLSIIGIVSVEIKFPDIGLQRSNVTDNCVNDIGLCITLRSIRTVGLFGLIIGLMNWVFIELLFRKITCIYGSGLIQKQYMTIRDSFRSIMMDILFDVSQLQTFFSERDERITKMLKLELRIGGLLNSNASQEIINAKIDDILKSPQGLILAHMGVDREKVREKIQSFVKAFIIDISPTIYRKLMVPGISDGEGLKSEISFILEPKLAQLKPMDVNKIIAVMIRKHLSWLIVWGSILGGVVGLVNELILLITVLTF